MERLRELVEWFYKKFPSGGFLHGQFFDMVRVGILLYGYTPYITDKIAVKKALAVYGRMPLMLLRNCPVKAQIGCKKCDGKGSLTDRMGKVFPVTCRMGYSTLLNSVPLVLDKGEDITALNYAILQFTTESEDEVAKTVKNYLNGTVCAEKDFTRGLYFRNVE